MFPMSGGITASIRYSTKYHLPQLSRTTKLGALERIFTFPDRQHSIIDTARQEGRMSWHSDMSDKYRNSVLDGCCPPPHPLPWRSISQPPHVLRFRIQSLECAKSCARHILSAIDQGNCEPTPFACSAVTLIACRLWATNCVQRRARAPFLDEISICSVCYYTNASFERQSVKQTGPVENTSPNPS
ncbi:unnamed protein product [Periconia digitata]|uniref:Uncharacterized protein n=1 Tax=Periconia digitata TaxID=1303443 RepID=A0A9W4XQB7_9PLEO|nr:unnamed protein product [Periconia digitata]